MVKSAFEEKIRDYAIDEGILGKSLPAEDNKLEFGYELNYPPNSPHPMKIMLIKLKDRKAVLLQLATQIAPPHIEGLKKVGTDGVFRYFEAFKKYMLVQNLLYNIDLQSSRYIISDTIYPDGFTEDRFYLTVRKLFNASLYMNTLLMEMIEGKIPIDSKGGSKNLDSNLFNAGNSMFT